jgi:hypothetical protein
MQYTTCESILILYFFYEIENFMEQMFCLSYKIIVCCVLHCNDKQFSGKCIFCALMCIVVLTLDAGLLVRSQYPEGRATGHLDTGFSCFPCVYKRMLRWFPSFQVATTCLSCSPPDLNSLVIFFFCICVHVKESNCS